jgi:hypothetical protein
MPSRSRPLGTALRTLIAACGLMLLLIGALQFFPRWKAAIGLRSWVKANQTPKAPTPRSPEETPTDQTEPADPFESTALSGSAAGRTAGADSNSVFAVENPASTVEIPVSSLEESDIPPPPEHSEPQPGKIGPPEFQRLYQHVLSLERRIAARENETSSADHDRTVLLLQQLDEQRNELKAVTARLGRMESQFEVIQEAISEKSSEKEKQELSSDGISIRTVRDGTNSRLMIEAREADLPELLVRLGDALGINLIVAPDVAGTVWLRLSQVDRDEALAAICRAHQCRCERTGNFCVVSRHVSEDQAAAPPPSPELISKLYRLKHLKGADVEPYVKPLLTPGVGAVGCAAHKDGTGTTHQDLPHSILVRDTRGVLAEVDRLIFELDRPSAKVEPLPVSTESNSPGLQPPQPVLQPSAALFAPESCTSVAPAQLTVAPQAAIPAATPERRFGRWFRSGWNRF